MSHPALASGTVAVITGAALGIGRALAGRLTAAGMKVALLDVDEAHLEDAVRAIGGNTLGLTCDVSDLEALEAARGRIEQHWGRAPSVLVNNAVTRIGRGFDADPAEWRRAFDINVMGVVNGVRTFLPGMLAQGAPGVVVNVGSKQGITNPPGHPVYNMAKAAIRSYTEQLQHDLRGKQASVTAHLLVPGWTTTGTNAHKPGAWLPEQVVERLLAALDRGEFYVICPDDEVSEEMDRARILWAAQDITENRPPLSRWHPDHQDAFAAFETNQH